MKLIKTIKNVITSHLLWVVGFTFIGIGSRSQNLIPNPSFEQFNDITIDDLDTSQTNFQGVQDWFHCSSISIMSKAAITSDTLEAIRGNLNKYQPFDGVAYATVKLSYSGGNLPGYRRNKTSPIQCKLTASLQAGCTYRFSMYVLFYAITYIDLDPYDSIATSRHFCSIKNLGAYFSQDRIFDSTSARGRIFDSINITPQVSLPKNYFITDTANYTRIEGTFVSSGGEQYLTIGSFDPIDSTEAYNFRTGIADNIKNIWGGYAWATIGVDSLNLYRMSPPDTLLTSSRDTSICPGDSLQLFAHAREALSINWDNGSTDSLRTITQPGTYWVDAYYPCGDVLSDTIVVTANEVLPPIALSDTTICDGETVQYTLPPGPAYQLDGNAIGNSFSLSGDGPHVVWASTTCESDSFTFNLSYIPVKDLPRISISDTALCEGDEMRVKLPGGFSYTLNNQALGDSLLVINERNQYTLEAVNSCEKRKYSFTVNDEGCAMQLYIPNAFTPDGDGLNDFFSLSISEYKSFHIAIFNRWGEMVFESRSPDDSWDGTVDGQKVAGSYTYVVKVDDGNSRHTHHGVVTVLR